MQLLLFLSGCVGGLREGGPEILCTWRTCGEAQNQCHAEPCMHISAWTCVHGSGLLSFFEFLSVYRCGDAALRAQRSEQQTVSELSSNSPYRNNPTARVISRPL